MDGETNGNPELVRDPVASTESEGGENPPEIVLVEDEGTVERLNNCDERPRRQGKPVKRLTYDELGKPTDSPVLMVYKGMLVHIGMHSLEGLKCKTLWCHPMAQCFKCSILYPSPNTECMLK